jgi:hypothetical protein
MRNSGKLFRKLHRRVPLIGPGNDDSPAALRAYEADPIHVKKVTEVLKPLSRKIVVYDITR